MSFWISGVPSHSIVQPNVWKILVLAGTSVWAWTGPPRDPAVSSAVAVSVPSSRPVLHLEVQGELRFSGTFVSCHAQLVALVQRRIRESPLAADGRLLEPRT